MNVAFEWEIRALLRKDSLHLNDNDRALIRQAILASDDKHCLITHGTDTMVETAAALGDLGERVVVMTGALNPARFIDSDAVFNIGCAVGAVQCLPPGIWITMNGRVWDPKKSERTETPIASRRFKPGGAVSSSNTVAPLALGVVYRLVGCSKHIVSSRCLSSIDAGHAKADRQGYARNVIGHRPGAKRFQDF